MNKFNPGDVVRLKSSRSMDAYMTVEGEYITSHMGTLIRTVWFDLNNDLQRDKFSQDCLYLVSKNLNYVEPEEKVQDCCSQI